MIRAEMFDGIFIRVAPLGLDLLLRHGQVKRFLRSSGWVDFGKDPIRSDAKSRSYSGNERRHDS